MFQPECKCVPKKYQVKSYNLIGMLKQNYNDIKKIGDGRFLKCSQCGFQYSEYYINSLNKKEIAFKKLLKLPKSNCCYLR